MRLSTDNNAELAGVPRYEERSAGAHDSAPLREIKRAVAKIKVETDKCLSA